MKVRNEAGIRVAPANVTRAQASRCTPLCSPETPSTQTATKRVNVANHLLMALLGRASQTNPASARRRATSARSGTKGTASLTSVRGAENHREMRPSQTVRVDEHCTHSCGAVGVRDVVKITLRIRRLVVDSWRDSLVSQGEATDNDLYCATRGQGLPTHRFGRRYGHIPCVAAEDALDSGSLGGVIVLH